MHNTEDLYREFWHYLSQTQRDLILEGEYLMNDLVRHGNAQFKDYSFVIFPFAKAYEGFLKQLFRDVKFISHLDYISDHLRLGKLLSPNLEERLGEKSLYKKLREATSGEMAERIWRMWKLGRNQVFHYFPHNVKAVSLLDAERMVNDMLVVMEESYQALKHYMNAEKIAALTN